MKKNIIFTIWLARVISIIFYFASMVKFYFEERIYYNVNFLSTFAYKQGKLAGALTPTPLFGIITKLIVSIVLISALILFFRENEAVNKYLIAFAISDTIFDMLNIYNSYELDRMLSISVSALIAFVFSRVIILFLLNYLLVVKTIDIVNTRNQGCQ